jgi:hypothetical protein
MKTVKITCDICGESINPSRGWEEAPHPINVTVTCSCQNPLGNLKEAPGYQAVNLNFEDVCRHCSKKIAWAIYKEITNIRELI